MGLHLIVRKDRLWSVAADPFCAAYDSAACVADESIELTLPRFAVDFILREVAALKKDVRDATTIRITEAGISVAGAALAYASLDGFPDWRVVLPTSRAATDRISVNPYFLARLQKVAKLSGISFADISFGGSLSPLDIQIGDTFRVIVMPLRAHTDRKVAELPELAEAKVA